ncbi:MAG: endonuclease domain-containing protein [Caulobacteraceae bacterium]
MRELASSPFPLDGGRAGNGGEGLSGKGAKPTHATGAVKRARRLRKEQTFAERLMWGELRKLKANYRRQAPMGRFVVDFIHHDSRVVIEVDGPFHDLPERQVRDAARTIWLESQGYRVIRFGEDAVRNDLFTVIERIEAERLSPPSPALPPSRGKGVMR